MKRAMARPEKFQPIRIELASDSLLHSKQSRPRKGLPSRPNWRSILGKNLIIASNFSLFFLPQ